MGFDANFCMSSLFDGEDRDPMPISLQNTSSHLPYVQGCSSLFLYYILGGFAFSLQGQSYLYQHCILKGIISTGTKIHIVYIAGKMNKRVHGLLRI